MLCESVLVCNFVFSELPKKGWKIHVTIESRCIKQLFEVFDPADLHLCFSVVEQISAMAGDGPRISQTQSGFWEWLWKKGDDSVQCGICADHSMVFCSQVVSDISGQKTKSHLNTHIFRLHQHAYIITPPTQLFLRKKNNSERWHHRRNQCKRRRRWQSASQGKPLQTTRVCWNLTFFIGISSHKLFVSQRWTTFLRFKPVQTRVFWIRGNL